MFHKILIILGNFFGMSPRGDKKQLWEILEEGLGEFCVFPTFLNPERFGKFWDLGILGVGNGVGYGLGMGMGGMWTLGMGTVGMGLGTLEMGLGTLGLE